MALSSNSVKMVSDQIEKIQYVDQSLVIKSGVKSDPPPSISQKGSTWTITLDADREGSSGVADSFNKATGGSLHEYAPDGGGGGSPDKLNFYYAVDVEFSGVSSKVRLYLGQGHFALTNNWWIGGSNVLKDDNAFLVLNDGGTVFTITGSTSEFDFKST